MSLGWTAFPNINALATASHNPKLFKLEVWLEQSYKAV